MCGICGYYRFDGGREEPGALARMNATLHHRGPDGAGIVEPAGAGLAMSRLSIIDPAGGMQPIANEDSTCWIVCNGEIYNFRELRAELEARGHVFRTGSDTEAALHAWEQWGDEFVRRLRGMFALAVHDSGRRRLVLARDRAGKKPLFYWHSNGRLLFGSEIKALLAHPEVTANVNRPAVPLYLAHGYVPGPQTMFEGVFELDPGASMTVNPQGIAIERYWQGLRAETARIEEPEACERLRTLLEDAVTARLVSDVPLGAFLSGGLDSTAVVAMMARHSGRPVKTFSIGFGPGSFDETAWARKAARYYGTEHHEFIVEPQAAELADTLVRHYDQPFGDSSALPMYLLSRETRREVTVALSGDGGDELFAGYERFAAARLGGWYQRLPRAVRGGFGLLTRSWPESTHYRGFMRRVRRFLEAAELPLEERYLRLAGIFDLGQIRTLTGDGAGVEPHFARYFEPAAGSDILTKLLYVNAATYLPGDLLVKADRMSMANSLEVRSPLLDQELAEFAASLPASMKLRGLQTKRILKKALAGIVPPGIIRRKKHGFGVPVGEWFRGPLKDYARSVVLSQNAANREYFRPEAVSGLLGEHLTGARDHGHRLWALLTFELWHRRYVG